MYNKIHSLRFREVIVLVGDNIFFFFRFNVGHGQQVAADVRISQEERNLEFCLNCTTYAAYKNLNFILKIFN